MRFSLTYLTLHHSNTVLLGNLSILRLLDQIPKDSQDYAGDLLLDGIAEDVGEDWDDIELVHLFGEQRIEGEDPQAEDELVLHLEVDAAGQDRQQSGNAVDGDEGETVLVNAEHHLEAASHRLDVLVVLLVGQRVLLIDCLPKPWMKEVLPKSFKIILWNRISLEIQHYKEK